MMMVVVAIAVAVFVTMLMMTMKRPPRIRHTMHQMDGRLPTKETTKCFPIFKNENIYLHTNVHTTIPTHTCIYTTRGECSA